MAGARARLAELESGYTREKSRVDAMQAVLFRQPGLRAVPVERQKAGVLDELASERAKLLEQESAELEQQAERLAAEIKELNGQSAVGIS